MLVNGKHYRTVWMEGSSVKTINQPVLPHRFEIVEMKTHEDTAKAIKTMVVRGAGAIGATAGYGMAQAFLEAPDQEHGFNDYIQTANETMKNTRPTAQNLFYAIDRIMTVANKQPSIEEKRKAAVSEAQKIADEDAEACKMIGEHGLKIIEKLSQEKNCETVNILTHCNAGWLAFVDHGSATSPIYAAMDKGIKVHVWVDETRPRNQGARLTAWELGSHGVPHTIIADNAGGHLMQHGMVDLVIVGTDRTTSTGDVANKIGTYLKALAAKDNNVPFYVALPSSTFDWKTKDGLKEITIEQRGSEEVKYIQGLCDGQIKKILITPENSPAANFAFDVTPARLVTGLITEKGIVEASENGISELIEKR